MYPETIGREAFVEGCKGAVSVNGVDALLTKVLSKMAMLADVGVEVLRSYDRWE